MNDEQKTAIREDAEQAAKNGKTPNERCPHPFSSDQGQYWTNCYWSKREELHAAKLARRG